MMPRLTWRCLRVLPLCVDGGERVEAAHSGPPDRRSPIWHLMLHLQLSQLVNAGRKETVSELQLLMLRQVHTSSFEENNTTVRKCENLKS